MKKWPKYFLTVCEAVAFNSACLSRQIGSILVRDKSIVATRYNGPPRGIPHCGRQRFMEDDSIATMLQDVSERHLVDVKCPRKLMGFDSGQGLQFCYAAHAERNCLINAARLGVPVFGCELCLNDIIPCKDCMIEIINAGITKVYVTELKHYDPGGPWLANKAGILIETFDGEPLLPACPTLPS